MISGAFKAFSGFFLVKWSKENKYIKKTANKQRRRDRTPGTGHRALGTRHTPTEFASTPRSKPSIRQVHLLGSARPSPQVRVRKVAIHRKHLCAKMICFFFQLFGLEDLRRFQDYHKFSSKK